MPKLQLTLRHLSRKWSRSRSHACSEPPPAAGACHATATTRKTTPKYKVFTGKITSVRYQRNEGRQGNLGTHSHILVSFFTAGALPAGKAWHSSQQGFACFAPPMHRPLYYLCAPCIHLRMPLLADHGCSTRWCAMPWHGRCVQQPGAPRAGIAVCERAVGPPSLHAPQAVPV